MTRMPACCSMSPQETKPTKISPLRQAKIWFIEERERLPNPTINFTSHPSISTTTTITTTTITTTNGIFPPGMLSTFCCSRATLGSPSGDHGLFAPPHTHTHT
ncbi:hypothetical protein VOLCADRAFT_87072 [Volvox carteri f. nagariensis]|uniref:Uncharacterized protein n=1 Tax=Volvox carteri f. nagariensis TaxID=3068 RepID=D8TK35_VOLCA|nr:uncharacterized protein VOLCADRAFT_87072 [Volvox carteri f. nagariensis]EFJ51992.1 hypothetical protein VOLCADRAFT_87072 [Volvox carteri f. nagariensis]|eukprot:XP_002946766.1 hypothetical protein VOLCADRAFT_87072 [Volvox carteri f. nagariensis]